jgi:hypothetical protein
LLINDIKTINLKQIEMEAGAKGGAGFYNAYIIDFSKFSKKFVKTFDKFIREGEFHRGYQRFIVEERAISNPEEYSEDICLIIKELYEFGLRESDVVLFENDW